MFIATSHSNHRSRLWRAAPILFVAVCLLVWGPPLAAGAAEPDPDVTPLVGLTFKDATIARALELFVDGKKQEAIDSLNAVINDPAQRDKERQRELQVAVVMLQIRSGESRDFATGRSQANNYSKRFTGLDVGVRAEVLSLVADSANKDGSKSFEKLGPHEKWLEYLRHVARKIEIEIDTEHRDLTSALPAEKWGNIRESLIKMGRCIECRHAIKIDSTQLSEVIESHALRLKAAIQSLDSKFESIRDEAESYRDQWRRANPKAKGSFRDKGNRAIKRAEECHRVLQQAIELYNDLKMRFPNDVGVLNVSPRGVPARIE